MKKLFILLLLSPLLCIAEIYKWVDENGKVHYSDKPFEKQGEQVIDERQLRRAISSVEFVSIEILPAEIIVNKQSHQVVMYATQRCGYCAKARRYFSENNIDYIEKDIDISIAARQEFDRAGGRGVPLIFVGKYKITGFNQDKFSRVFNKVYKP